MGRFCLDMENTLESALQSAKANLGMFANDEIWKDRSSYLLSMALGNLDDALARLKAEREGGSLKGYASYKEAKKRAQDAGIQTGKEWHKLCEQYTDLPTKPYITYRDSWTSWEVFLGERPEVIHGYDVARKEVMEAGIHSKSEYMEYQQTHRHLPEFPEIHYAVHGKAWKSWDDFLSDNNGWFNIESAPTEGIYMVTDGKTRWFHDGSKTDEINKINEWLGEDRELKYWRPSPDLPSRD